MNTLSAVIHAINRAGAMHWDFASAMFVQVVALVAILGLVELCLRRRVRPVVRYWLWTLVILKLLLPVTLRTPASVAYWIVSESRPTANTVVAPSGAPPGARPLPPLANAPQLNPAPLVEPTEPQFVADGPGRPALEEMRRAPIPNDEAPATVVVSQPLPSMTPPGWIFVGWCGGCLMLGAIVLRRTARVRQLVRRAGEAPRELMPPLNVACELLDLSARRIRLKISDEVGCPAVCGFWRPTILIPVRLVGRLDREQLQLIFVHELAHWKRWDLQLNLLQTVLQVVYFYNPAVWIANAVLRRLREEAVDDAVLIAMGNPAERYSNTLLDVATQALRPLELNVRLIGILESRKTLASRIHRLATTPLPKSARLGIWGFATVALIGLAVLPMAGRRALLQAEQKNAPQVATAKVATAKVATPSGSAGLSGRITDENGVPVADARVEIYRQGGGQVYTAYAKADGSYQFGRVDGAGVYQINVFSTRCLGLTDWNEARSVRVDPANPSTRDIVLKPACQMRVSVLDEAGHPISRVNFYNPGRYDGSMPTTSKSGTATLGGLIPSPVESRFGIYHKDFVIAAIDVKLDDPKVVVEKKITLTKGRSVRGVVLCSDGKPAANWGIKALPGWWNFMASPSPLPIQKDGSFELPHIGPGPYQVSVMIPEVGGMSSQHVVQSDVDLFNRKGPLNIKLDYPSPGALTFIEGHIHFLGGKPSRGFWVHADGNGANVGQFVQPGEDKLKIGPLPDGLYRLSVNSQELELSDLLPIKAGKKDLVLDLHVRGQMRLQGVVTAGQEGQPVNNLRTRVIKLSTLRGPNYTGDPNWHGLDDPNGRFTAKVPGPGIYVEATADGYTITRSAPVNTDQQLKQEIRLKLSKGVQLSGTIVDQSGRPIDGATVLTLSRDRYPLPVSTLDLSPRAGITAVKGKFHFDNLSPGKETFRAVHPDFTCATVEDFELKEGSTQVTLTIVMKQGGIVRGHVFDENGRPAPQVHLDFQDRNGYSGPDWEKKGRYATVSTDASGFYEAKHLPLELVYLRREKEWDALGVVRQAVLPSADRPSAVDFGGPTKIAGLLVLNGEPVAEKRVLLSGENPNFGIMKAFSRTDANGRFEFRGISPGERYLYVENGPRGMDWIRIKPLLIESSNQDFGTIQHTTTTLVVRLRPGDDHSSRVAQVALRYYDPVWFGLEFAGPAAPRSSNEQPFVFRNLAIGKYALSTFERGRLGVRRVVEITGAQREQSISLDSPAGTASIYGQVDQALCGPGGCNGIQLRSKDNWLQGTLDVKPDGKFLFAGLPAGEYYLTQQGITNADALAVFNVANGDRKAITIPAKLLGWRPLPKGFLQIRTHTVDGIPLPGCRVVLSGPKGEIAPNSSQQGQVTFIAEPGRYQLSATYAGYKPVVREVEMKSTQGGRWNTHDNVLDVMLVPLGSAN